MSAPVERGRVEHLDQPLERHVGVGEGGEVASRWPGPSSSVNGAPRVDLGAQHQGVDEHADEVVERALAAAGDRRADGDVVGAGQPGEQHGQGGVHHHEQGGAVSRGQPRRAAR